jgi:hypothetical protein
MGDRLSALARLPATGLVPELGPALGRVCDRAAPARGRWVRLDDVRLALATGVFELAGAARAFAVAEDRAAAVTSLNRQAWLAEWERAVAEATDRIARAVDARFDSAAREARLPGRLRKQLPLVEADRHALSGRLGAGSLPFLQSLEALERTVPSVSAAGQRGEAAVREWQEMLLAVARRLESAWLALEAATVREESLWAPEIERVRAWRRPTWPLWLVTVVVLACATYLGLAFGGYLPVPEPLLPVAQEVWRGER